MLLFLLFFLVAGHALMDFALQGDATAVCKCRKANSPLQKSVPWYYWMMAHAVLHGAVVGVIIHWTGFTQATVVAYAATETVIHFVADVLKCENLTNIHVDQGIHIVCKVAWAVMLVNGATL